MDSNVSLNQHVDSRSRRRPWCARVVVTVVIISLILIAITIRVIFKMTSDSGTVERNDKDDHLITIFTGSNGSATKSCVVADHKYCSNVGMKVLKAGGNAVDSAVAVLFCQGLVEPHQSGLGGGFLMNIYIKEKGEVVTLDARVVAPLHATSNMFNEDVYNRSDDKLAQTGWLSVAVPGELMGLWEAHHRYGRLHWVVLITPSIYLAKAGFPVSANLDKSLKEYKAVINKDPYLRKLFTNPKTNQTYMLGETMRHERYAEVLKNITISGYHYVYNNNFKLIEECIYKGGILTSADFKNYRVRWSKAISYDMNVYGQYYRLLAPPSPSYGVLIGAILNIMSDYITNLELGDYQMNLDVPYHHKIIESMKHAFAKSNWLDDFANKTADDISYLLSSHFGSQIRSLIDESDTFSLDYYLRGESFAKSYESGSSCACVVDEDGNAVAVCSSLNNPFGAGVFSENLGFILNNNLFSYELTNAVNERDETMTNRIQPKKRSITAMCPIFVFDPMDELKLVMVASGDARVPTALALVLIRYFWMKNRMLPAISNPMLHHGLIPEKVLYEGNLGDSIVQQLDHYGHAIEVANTSWPHILAVLKENGTLTKFGDLRRRMCTVLMPCL